MKKILIVSDLTLNNVFGNAFFNDCEIEYNFSEDLLSVLMTLNPEAYDIIYIHADQWFKYYDETYIQDILNQVVRLSEKAKRIFLSNLILLNKTAAPAKSQISQSINNNLSTIAEELAALQNVYFLDHQKGLMTFGINECYNFNLGYLYQMPYKKKFIDFLKASLKELMDIVNSEEKKAIILDCDNTLWKGITGEDGVDGIYCDKTKDGIIFYHFQNFLKRKKQEGFVLCIASKNNLEDVIEVFDRKKMPLEWDDFVIKEINWDNKVTTISSIAGKLNIGVSSLIFIDDNEFELNSVKDAFPEITCIRIENTANSLHSIFDHPAFIRKNITAEDERKTLLYVEEEERSSLRVNISIEEYIKKLDIRTDIRLNDVSTFERLSQLSGKTNQFNFNKIPYSVPDLQKIIAEHGQVYSISAYDIYGDYGIIGMAILLPGNENEMKLHNLLLSCRALGRGIESTFFNHILADLERQDKRLAGIEFKETEKNKPARDFRNTLSL